MSETTATTDTPALKKLLTELSGIQQEHKALTHFMSITANNIATMQNELAKQQKCQKDLVQKIKHTKQQIEAEQFKIETNEQPGDMYLVQHMISKSEGGTPILREQTFCSSFDHAKQEFDTYMYELPQRLDDTIRNIFPCGTGARLLCVKADYDQCGDSYTAIIQLRALTVD